MDWIMYTIGVVAHLWTIIGLLQIWLLLDDPRVKYHGAKITIGWIPMVASVGLIAFWMWFFFG
jgi:hypothetical protein